LDAVARGGADVIEVGVPFSDPLADGPVIQRASERALAAGMTLRGSLALVREVRREAHTAIVLVTFANPVGGLPRRASLARVREFRREHDTPIVLFTYANPVVRMDPETFAAEARDAG